MPSLSQCTITGSLYDVNGDLVGVGTRVTIVKTVKSGQVIMHTPDVSTTSALGVVTLTAPRSSTIYVYAKAIGLEENGIAGVALTVPSSATANLEDLISVSTTSATGLTVKDEGTAFASLVGTINFVGSGVSAVETSAGLATVTITAGAGVTLREVDGAPSLAASTVEFAQGSGFVVTDQTGGVGRVDLLAIPVNKLAALTASRVPVTDGSGFLSASAVPAATLAFLDATSSVQTQINARLTQAAADALYQPLDADLTAIAGLTSAADRLPYFTGSGTASLATFTAAGRAILDDLDATAQRATLGLVIGTDVQAFDSDLGALAANATNGLWARTGAGTGSARTITGTSNQISVSNGDGVSGNPTLSTPQDIHSGASPSFVGLTLTGSITFPDNVRQTFNPGADAAGLNVGALAGDPGTPVNGDLWYDSTANELTARINGANVALGAGGGGGATTALDNLASVAINTDLLPASTQSLGNASFPFLSSFTGNTTQYESVAQSAGLITHSALGSATNIGFSFLPKGSGQLKIGAGVDASVLATQLYVGAAGLTGVTVRDSTNDVEGFWFTNTSTMIFGAFTNHPLILRANNVDVLAMRTDSNVGMNDNASLLWGISGTPTGTMDVGIKRFGVAQFQIHNGTAGQWGSLLCGTRDAGTTTVTNGLTVGHQSTGTPAAGLGSAVLYRINSSTTADQDAAQTAALWTTATHASRTADWTLSLVNNAAALAEVFRVKANALIVQPQTITAGGTTGAQTIDKPAGTVNMAAGQAALVVTNALVSASSQVFAVIRTNDTTSQIKNVVPTTGSFTINLVSSATAETSIGFWVINA